MKKIKFSGYGRPFIFMVAVMLLSTVVAVVMNLTQATTDKNSAEAAPLPRFKAPSFTLKNLSEDKTFSLGKSLDKPLVINFWASWCPPCQQEAPELVDFYEKHKQEIDFYGINLTHSDRISDVENFVKKYQLNFPVLLDPEGEVSRSYWINTVPTTLLISKDGVILDRHLGYISKQDLNSYINKIGGQ